MLHHLLSNAAYEVFEVFSLHTKRNIQLVILVDNPVESISLKYPWEIMKQGKALASATKYNFPNDLVTFVD